MRIKDVEYGLNILLSCCPVLEKQKNSATFKRSKNREKLNQENVTYFYECQLFLSFMVSEFFYFLKIVDKPQILLFVGHESESHLVVSNSLWPQGLYSPRHSPGQNTRVGEPFPSSGGSSQPRDRTYISRIAGGFFTFTFVGQSHQ